MSGKGAVSDSLGKPRFTRVQQQQRVRRVSLLALVHSIPLLDLLSRKQEGS